MQLNTEVMQQLADTVATEVMARLAQKERAQSRSKPSEVPRRLLTYDQAGARLGGKSADAVRKMVKRNQLKCTRIPKSRIPYIDERDLTAYMDSGSGSTLLTEDSNVLRS